MMLPHYRKQICYTVNNEIKQSIKQKQNIKNTKIYLRNANSDIELDRYRR